MSSHTIPVSLFGEILEPGSEFNLDTFTLARLTSVSLDEKAEPKSKTFVKIKFIQEEPRPVDSDDEDEDAESEESEEEEGQEKEIVLACLEAGKNDFQSLDMVLPIGQTFTFTTSGTNKVHLLGQYLDAPEALDDDYDEDYEDYDEEDMSDLDMSDEMSADEDLSGRIREIKEDEETPKKDAKKAQQPKKSALKNSPAAQTPKSDKSETKSDAGTPELSKNQKKKLAKKQKQEASGADDKPKVNGNATEKKRPNESSGEAKHAKKPSNRTVHPSGLVVEEKGTGNGPTAQSGRKVSMRYIGRLQNGKVFDSNLKGKPLSFTLGKGQVIQGWDEGIKGLALGGERRLTIPPHLAYGKKGVPGIPGNSTLIFDVKLLGVK